MGYPRNGMAIAVRDTNFIFGSTGRGDARLRIDGRQVPVQPNGAFLAFLPVPPDGVYHLEARAGGQVDTLTRVVRLPDSLPAAPDTVAILPGSMYPTGAWVALPHERIDVGFRGTAGGTATLVLPGGDRVPLVEVPAESGEVDRNFSVNAGQAGPGVAAGWSDYRGFFAARRLFTLDTAVAWPRLTGEWRPVLSYHVPPPPDDSAAMLELARGADTVRATLPLNLLLADPDRPRVGVAWDSLPPEANGDSQVIARPGPGSGPYNYFWINGTELSVTGQRGRSYRVHLADGLDAWSNVGDVALADPATPPPHSRVDLVRLVPSASQVDVHVALHAPLPYRVEEGDHQIRLVVFGADSRVEFLQHGAVDPFVRRAEWYQPADGVFRLTVFTSRTPWGYVVRRDPNGDLVLSIRKPPHIDPDQPFHGLTVAVDPGHGGADRATVGPTGLTEADANLRHQHLLLPSVVGVPGLGGAAPAARCPRPARPGRRPRRPRPGPANLDARHPHRDHVHDDPATGERAARPGGAGPHRPGPPAGHPRVPPPTRRRYGAVRRRVYRHGAVQAALLAGLALLASAGQGEAQAVPPDVAWKTIETEHFRVSFTPGLVEQARITAAVAESAYTVLARDLKRAPRRRIDIAVADQVDFSNGLTQPFPSDRIVIFVRPPIENRELQYERSWLELVVVHELTHAFHLNATGGLGHLARRVFGRIPSSWPLFP
ncbi:MAG: hypothetical protein P8174_09620, partial [Gemmatimonadota bacterium]